MKNKIISALCAVTVISSLFNFSCVKAEDNTLYCLSANTWRETTTRSDKILYEKKGINLINLDTGATYTWTEDSDAGVRENDAIISATGEKVPFGGNEMQGGDLENMSGNVATHATWKKESTGTVLYDLKDVYWVSRVDVWSHTKKNIQIGDCIIRVGETAEDLKYINSFAPESIPTEEEIEAQTQVLTYTPCVFPATRARYVEITYTTEPGKFQVIPAEMVVFGTKEKPEEETEEIILEEEELSEELITTVKDLGVTEQNNIIIPLQDVYELTKIDLTQYQSNASGIDSYEVYLSSDGENYSWIGKCENNNKTIFNSKTVSYSMPYKTYSKYLKIKVNPSAGKDAMVTDISVYGKAGKEQQALSGTYSYYIENPFRTETDIRFQDADCNKLTDGDENSWIKTNNQYATIVMDLGRPYQIGDIDIYSLSDGNTFMDGCEIKYSFDGEKFFSYTYYINDNERNAERIVKSTFSGMPGKNARYLKIIAQSSGKDLALSEIRVHGYDVHQKTTKKMQKVPLRVDTKNYAICYIDWSTYNSTNTSKYALYIEKQPFTSTYGLTPIRVIESYEPEFANKYLSHTILEPETDYYIAVTPFDELGNEFRSVAPTKITTRSVIGDQPRDIFNIVQHPLWGDANVANSRYGSNWSKMYEENARLMDELELVGKTRWYHNTSAGIDPFSKYGITTMIINSNQIPLSLSQGNYLFSSGNEKDLSLYDTTAYYEWMRTDYNKLKAADKRAVLCGPVLGGTGANSLEWFDELYRVGNGVDTKNTFDYVDVHFYCKSGDRVPQGLPVSVPEALPYKIADVREVMERHGDGDKPIISTEIGWTTGELPGYQVALDYETQRNYFVRMYMIMMSEGVREVWQYCFQDDGTDLYNTEYNWGLIDYFGVPKPSYYGYYNLTHQMRYTKYLGAVQGLTNPYYGFMFFDEGKEKYISSVWAADNQEKTLNFETLSGEDEKVEVIGTDGTFRTIQTVDGKGSVKISGAPMFIYSEKGIKANEVNVAFAADTTNVTTHRGEKFTVSVQRKAMGEGISGKVIAKNLPDGWYLEGNLEFNAKDSIIPVTVVVPENAAEEPAKITLVFSGSDGSETSIQIDVDVASSIDYKISFEPISFGDWKEWNIVVDCTNTGETPQNMSLQITGAEGIQTNDMAEKIVENLGSGETERIIFRVTKTSNDQGAVASFRLRANGGEKLFDRSMDFSACINDGITPNIDGVIEESEWGACNVIEQDSYRYSKWLSTDDLSFKAYRKWDEENFYMAIDVTDDVFFQEYEGSLVYLGDNLQIALDFARKDGVGTQNTDYYEFGISRNNDNKLMAWTWLAQLAVKSEREIPSVEGAVNRTDDNHTIYEFAIPWGYFVETDIKEGDVIGFSMCVNENDGTGRKGWLMYMNGIAGTKDADLFEDMVLIKK